MNIEITTNAPKFLEYLELKGVELEKEGIKVFHKAVNDIFKFTVIRTPIGKPELWKHPEQVNEFEYVPGTLRNAWKLQFPDNYTGVLSNNTIYAERIEYGWSTKQAPQGMLRISLADFPGQMEYHANNNSATKLFDWDYSQFNNRLDREV